MTYDATIQDCSGPIYRQRGAMIYDDIREFCENQREHDVSRPQEIVGTAVFTAGMVSVILFVLTNFIL
jgi:hypothetical protein